MARISKITKKRLGEILIDAGLLVPEQVDEALKKQKETGELFGEILVKLGYVTETDIAKAIVTQFGFPFIRSTLYELDDDLIASFPIGMLKKHQFIPLDKIGNILTVIIAGTLNEEVLEDIEKMSNRRVQVYVGISSDVNRVIDERGKKPEDALSTLGSMLLGDDESTT